MSMDKMIPLMLGGIKDTLYMTTVSTLFAYLLGLPIAILLVLTAPSGLKPQKLVYRLLDMIVNIFRSIPFLILMILVIPRHPRDCGQGLRLDSDDRSPCHCGRAVCRPHD